MGEGKMDKLKIKPHVRWMIRRDMPEVMETEQLCFEFPWSEEQFINCLREMSCIGMIAEHNEQVVGHMVYGLRKGWLHILNFAVHPSVQRLGVGTTMVEKLKSKLSCIRRNRLVLEIRDSNLDAHLFFRAMGFEAVDIFRDFFTNGEDAYQFVYYHQKTEQEAEQEAERELQNKMFN